jgi:hypothetical protein
LSETKQVSVKIYLPEDLRARFKSACALQKVSMNQILLDFVEEWTTQHEQPPAPEQSAKGKRRGKAGGEE